MRSLDKKPAGVNSGAPRDSWNFTTPIVWRQATVSQGEKKHPSPPNEVRQRKFTHMFRLLRLHVNAVTESHTATHAEETVTVSMKENLKSGGPSGLAKRPTQRV